MSTGSSQSRFARQRIAPNLFVRGDGKFEVKWTDSDGRYRSRTLEARNKTEAIKERDKLVTKHRSGESIAVVKKTVDDVAREYLDSFRSKVASGEKAQRTLDLYEQRYAAHLKERFGRTYVQAIRLRDVLAFCDELRASKLSAWTQRSVFHILSAILGFAVEREYLQANPCRGVSKDSKPKPRNASKARVLTPAEVQGLIAATPEHWQSLVITAAYTGLRQSELLGLRWQDVRLDEDVLEVRVQLSRATKDQPAALVRLKEDASVRDIEIAPVRHRSRAFESRPPSRD